AGHFTRLLPAVLDITQFRLRAFQIFHRDESLGLLQEGEFHLEVLLELRVERLVVALASLEEHILSCSEAGPQRVVVLAGGAARRFPLIHELPVRPGGGAQSVEFCSASARSMSFSLIAFASACLRS